MMDAGTEDLKGRMTAAKYISINKTSKAPATRDLQCLAELGTFIMSFSFIFFEFRIIIHLSATASYIIEIIRTCHPLQRCPLVRRLPYVQTSTICAYNLRLCKMLSLQRAKPFCATAFQPPGQL